MEQGSLLFVEVCVCVGGGGVGGRGGVVSGGGSSKLLAQRQVSQYLG